MDSSTRKFELIRLIDENQISRQINELSQEISSDFEDLCPLAVGVLKGAFIFLSDLVRRLTIPVTIDFISLSSYGAGTKSSGKITVRTPLAGSAEGRDVLIVEDIVDTGLTVEFLRAEFARLRARSVKVCTLLDKPSRRIVPVELDYVGFTVPDKFIVGYGIDYKEEYRNLPYIAFINLQESEERKE